MWSEDEEVQAALRGDYAVDPAKEVNWARIVAGAIVLTVVALSAIASVIYFTPA